MTGVALNPIVERRLRAVEEALARLPRVGAPGFAVDGIGAPVLPGGTRVGPGGLIPPGSKPANPTGLVLTPGADALDVWIEADWDPAPLGQAGPVVSWIVEALRDGETLPRVWTPTLTEAPPTLPFRMHGLRADSLYHVTVRAVTQLGASSTGLTGDASTGHYAGAPPQVTGLSAGAFYTGVVAKWTPLGSLAVPFTGHYLLEVADIADFSHVVASQNTGLAAVGAIRGLTTGTDYWLRVTAVTLAGVAGPASATFGPITPGKVAPGDLSAGTIATGVLYAGSIIGDQITGGTIDFTLARGLNLDVGDATVRGQLTADRFGAGTIGAYLIQLAAGGIIRSANYVAGTTGWSVDGAGNAEFNNVTVRAVLAAAALASNDLTIYDSSGRKASRLLTEMVTGTPRAWLQLGDGQNVGAGLNWWADHYHFALVDPGGGRPGLAFEGAADVSVEGLIRASGSVQVGGNAYSGGVYPRTFPDGTGGLDVNWGFELATGGDLDHCFTYAKAFLNGVGDRRVGWKNSDGDTWLAFANTDGDLNAATSWFVFSSRALKKQIKPLGPMTEKLKTLAAMPVTYMLKTDSHRTLPRIGLVAEDVETVFPELVASTGNIKALDYVGLVPVLIRAFGELEGRVAALESKPKK